MIRFSCQLSRPRFSLEADFNAPRGCVALFGPSGSGKTTIARLIAGLERPDRGAISVGERILVDTDAGIWTPVHKRRVGLVFQEGQLLPHLSVRQNLEYGGFFAPRDAEAVEFDAVVDILGIGHLLHARPATLSGGERQRVAIGRALRAAPHLLVMDEPLASLDSGRKLEILPFIERLRDELALPIVYVSHALDEVARLATTVVRMQDGRVVGQGTPADVFSLNEPKTVESAETVSFLSGAVARELPKFGMTILAHPAGEIMLPGRFGDKKRLRIVIPATSVALATEKPRGISVRTVLKGRVRSIAQGDHATALVTIELTGGDLILASLTRLAIADLGLTEDRDVYALIKVVSLDEHSVAMLDRLHR